MDTIRLYQVLAERGDLKKVSKSKVPKYTPSNESKAMTESDPADALKDNYGDLPLIQSVSEYQRPFVDLDSLSLESPGSHWLRARVHIIRIKRQAGFIITTLIVYYNTFSNQCL